MWIYVRLSMIGILSLWTGDCFDKCFHCFWNIILYVETDVMNLTLNKKQHWQRMTRCLWLKHVNMLVVKFWFGLMHYVCLHRLHPLKDELDCFVDHHSLNWTPYNRIISLQRYANASRSRYSLFVIIGSWLHFKNIYKLDDEAILSQLIYFGSKHLATK